MPYLRICGTHLRLKVGIFAKYIQVCDLRMVFNLLHVYNYTTKLCGQQAEGIQNHENERISNIGQDKTRLGNVRGLNHAEVRLTTIQVTKLPL
jgi:hypothetical protein